MPGSGRAGAKLALAKKQKQENLKLLKTPIEKLGQYKTFKTMTESSINTINASCLNLGTVSTKITLFYQNNDGDDSYLELKNSLLRLGVDIDIIEEEVIFFYKENPLGLFSYLAKVAPKYILSCFKGLTSKELTRLEKSLPQIDDYELFNYFTWKVLFDLKEISYMKDLLYSSEYSFFIYFLDLEDSADCSLQKGQELLKMVKESVSPKLSRKLFSKKDSKSIKDYKKDVFCADLQVTHLTPSLAFLINFDTLHDKSIIEHEGYLNWEILHNDYFGLLSQDKNSNIDLLKELNELNQLWSKNKSSYNKMKSKVIHSLTIVVNILIQAYQKSLTENPGYELPPLVMSVQRPEIIAGMLINEWELKKDNKICFYASRSNNINLLAKAIQVFADWIESKKYKDNKIDVSQINRLKSSLVESKCMRPNLRQISALEYLTQYYINDYTSFQLLIEKETNLEQKEKQKELFKKKKELLLPTLNITNAINIDLLDIYLDLNKKPLNNENNIYKILTTFTNGDVISYLYKGSYYSNKYLGYILDKDRLKESKLDKKPKQTKIEPVISDRLDDQKDRLRSANISFFGNITHPAESSFYMFVNGNSQTKAENIFEPIIHSNFDNLLQTNLKDEYLEIINTIKSTMIDYTINTKPNIGTILQFIFPCDIIDNYVYVSEPIGQIEYYETANEKGTELKLPSFQTIYNLISKVYNDLWDAKIRDQSLNKQVRILDLCWSDFGKKDGIEINFYKPYSDEYEAKFEKILKKAIKNI